MRVKTIDEGNRILAVASKEIGYLESPANTNKTKFGKWFGFDGVSWCGIFVSWCYAQAGCPLGNIGFLKGFAGCQTAVAHFKKNNQIVSCPEIGDIVFYDWQRDGRYDHTGIFAGWIDDEKFRAIEGNTSLKNQSNGGQVMRRERKKGKGVIFVRPVIS